MSEKPIIILCDDVRQEVANKSTLTGVYSSEVLINAPKLPAGLQKLCVFFLFKGIKEKEVTIFWEVPGEKENSHKIDVPDNFTDMNFVLEITPFAVAQSGDLIISYQFSGKKKMIGERFKIAINPAAAHK